MQLADEHALQLKDINNSSIHHEKLDISYSNGTLNVGKSRIYQISGG